MPRPLSQDDIDSLRLISISKNYCKDNLDTIIRSYKKVLNGALLEDRIYKHTLYRSINTDIKIALETILHYINSNASTTKLMFTLKRINTVKIKGNDRLNKIHVSSSSNIKSTNIIDMLDDIGIEAVCRIILLLDRIQ